MHVELNTECLCYTVGGNIIVSWPNTARCKHMIKGLTTLIDCTDNRFLYIRNNPGVNQSHTDFVQRGSQMLQVSILGSTRENLVADNNQATGDCFGHMASTTFDEPQ